MLNCMYILLSEYLNTQLIINDEKKKNLNKWMLKKYKGYLRQKIVCSVVFVNKSCDIILILVYGIFQEYILH